MPTVTGTVHRGHGVGRTLGFPTANLDVRPTDVPYGIYAAWVQRSTDRQTRYPAIAYWGERPVFDARKPSFEVYLIDFDGDLVAETLAVELVDRLRPDQRFDLVDELVTQMHEDVTAARRRLTS